MWCSIFNHWCKPVPYGTVRWSIQRDHWRSPHYQAQSVSSRKACTLFTTCKQWMFFKERSSLLFKWSNMNTRCNDVWSFLLWDVSSPFTCSHMLPPPLQLNPHIKTRPSAWSLWFTSLTVGPRVRPPVPQEEGPYLSPLKQQRWPGQGSVFTDISSRWLPAGTAAGRTLTTAGAETLTLRHKCSKTLVKS